jgi:hypothetical protein
MRTFAQKPKTTQQPTSAKSTIAGWAHFGQSREVNSILHLQRTIENQAVQRMLQTHAEELEVGLASTASPRFAHDFRQIPVHAKSPANVQAKLTVGPSGDIYEQEADRVSEQVIHMPEPQLQRACACGGGCPKCQTEQLPQEPERLHANHLDSGDPGQTAVPPIVDEVLSSPGQALDTVTRSRMESRFGHDFSKVRVHTDAKAAQAAHAIHAQAYTVGRDVVFGAARYLPGTSAGQRLLAHELTHVIQQRAAAPRTARAPGDREAAGRGTTSAAQQSQVRREPEAGFGNKPRALNAAEVKKFKAWDRDVDAALNVLVPVIHQRGMAFLDGWLIQMVSAKADASAPVEESQDHWAVALLGNLLWAASCFVPGAGVVKAGAAAVGWRTFRAGAAAAQTGASLQVAKAAAAGVGELAEGGMTNLGKKMYATMAMGGSLAAAGVVQKLASDPSGEPSGKDVVAIALNTKRMELGEVLKGNVERLAYDMVLGGFSFDRYQSGREKYLTGIEEILWANIFPSIPVNDLNAIYKSGLSTINGALADFKVQYREWRDNTQRCANRFFVPMTQTADTKDWPDEIKSGREEPLQYCQRKLPFKPKLNF